MRRASVIIDDVEHSPREREHRANDHGARATAMRLAGQPAAALGHADAGVALVEGLLAERPDDPTTINVLASQLYNRAAIREQLGQPALGIPDARRSVELYQRLAGIDYGDSLRQAAYVADAQLRLARLTALGPQGADQGTADGAREMAARGLSTYMALTEQDPRYGRDLARIWHAFGEVLRILAEAADEQVPKEALMSYVNALEIYDALGTERTDEDRRYYALTLLRTARMHQHPDAEIVDTFVAAMRASEELWQLVLDGHGLHNECVAALHLYAALAWNNDARDWEEPLLAARMVLTRMHRPLIEETAAIERDIERLLRERGR